MVEGGILRQIAYEPRKVTMGQMDHRLLAVPPYTVNPCPCGPAVSMVSRANPVRDLTRTATWETAPLHRVNLLLLIKTLLKHATTEFEPVYNLTSIL